MVCAGAAPVRVGGGVKSRQEDKRHFLHKLLVLQGRSTNGVRAAEIMWAHASHAVCA